MNCRKLPGCAAEAGAAAVEAALIMSALLLAGVGIAETARALWTYNTMLIAVEEAGRYAMTYNHHLPVVCMAQAQASQCPALSNTPLANCSASYAQQILAAYRVPAVAVSVSSDTATSPPTVTICASYSFIAPYLLPYGPFDFTSRVTVPLL
jgi:Flp pilus assembly protein TadG